MFCEPKVDCKADRARILLLFNFIMLSSVYILLDFVEKNIHIFKKIYIGVLLLLRFSIEGKGCCQVIIT